jgi:hypothetical protein
MRLSACEQAAYELAGTVREAHAFSVLKFAANAGRWMSEKD